MFKIRHSGKRFKRGPTIAIVPTLRRPGWDLFDLGGTMVTLPGHGTIGIQAAADAHRPPRPDSQPFETPNSLLMPSGDIRYDVVAVLELRRKRRRLRRAGARSIPPGTGRGTGIPGRAAERRTPGSIAEAMLPRRIHLGNDQGPVAGREML